MADNMNNLIRLAGNMSNLDEPQSIHNSFHSIVPDTTKHQPIPLPSSKTRVLRSQTAHLAAVAAIAASKVTKPKPRPRPQRRPPHLDPWYPKRKRNPNPKPRTRRPLPSHFTCRICIEHQPADQFIPYVPPKRYHGYPEPNVPRCCIPHLTPHPIRSKEDPICKTCIGAHMSARLDMYGARKVSKGCLDPGCGTYWTDDQVLRFFPGGAPLEKYNMAMMDVWKDQVGDALVPCVSDSCNSVGLVEVMARGYPQVACSACELRMCAECRVPWHTGFVCAEWKARHINEAMTDEEKVTLEMLQQKDGKRCPNCHIVIEKDGGCNSMYCGGCKTYFDWATAASAVPGAKKAVTVQQANLDRYGNNDTPLVCEVDGMSVQKAEKVDAGST